MLTMASPKKLCMIVESDVLAAHEPAVEEGQARQHDHHQGGRSQQPGRVPESIGPPSAAAAVAGMAAIRAAPANARFGIRISSLLVRAGRTRAQRDRSSPRG